MRHLFIILICVAFIKGYSSNEHRNDLDSIIRLPLDTLKRAVSKSNQLDFVDSTLVHITLLDPEEDLFTPSFFAVNSGLYKFPIILDVDDYGWVSKNVMVNHQELFFEKDTTPRLTAEYDHGYPSTHWFNAVFNRNIGSSMLYSSFARRASEPLYNNTRATRSNFSIGSHIPLREHVNITLSYFRNEAFIEENGGISNIDSIATVELFDASTLLSNLTTAKNNIFNQKAVVLQEITLQTWQKDSVLPNKSRLIFSLESSISENRYSFELNEADIDGEFFSEALLDTTQTFDSIGFKKIEINPELKFSSSLNKFFSIGLHKQQHDKALLNNSFVYFKLSNLLKGKLFLISGKYYFENYWTGNYDISLDTDWGLNNKRKKNNRKINVFSQLNYKEQLPSYLFLNYFGNHFSWNNDFNPIQKLTFKTVFDFPNIVSKVDFNYQNIQNYIYLNDQSTPQQSPENIHIGKVHLKNKIGNKWVSLYNGIGFQWASSDVIRIPHLFCRNSLVFNFNYHHVPFSFGTTFNFFSKYKGLNYNPAIRHYHLGKQEVGGTPVIDLFMAARLGPADLYIKYDNSFYHFNRNLFLGESYPIYKSYLRFGLKWNLLN